MRRKVYRVLLAGMTTLFFAACGSSQTSDSLPTEVPTQAVVTEAITEIPEANTPTPVPTPTSTPTPEPTATSTPSPTPEPTATSTPTPEPTVTSTPTPEPTATSTPTPEPTATSTPTPTPTTPPTPTPTNTPTPTLSPQMYTYTDLQQILYASGTVSVYRLPGTNEKNLGNLAKGERVEVTGKCNEVNWYRIKYRGTTGYVNGSYLLETNPLPSDDNLRTIESLFDVPVFASAITDESNAYRDALNEIEAGNVEKVKYVCSTGEVFRLWNIRISDERHLDIGEFYYWLIAPQGDTFSSGYQHNNWTAFTTSVYNKDFGEEEATKELERKAIEASEAYNDAFAEARVGYVSDKPKYPVYADGETCPIETYTIVQEEDRLYFWWKSTDHPSRQCDGTCNKCVTLAEAKKLAEELEFGTCVPSDNQEATIWNDTYYYKYELISLIK